MPVLIEETFGTGYSEKLIFRKYCDNGNPRLFKFGPAGPAHQGDGVNTDVMVIITHCLDGTIRNVLTQNVRYDKFRAAASEGGLTDYFGKPYVAPLPSQYIRLPVDSTPPNIESYWFNQGRDEAIRASAPPMTIAEKDRAAITLAILGAIARSPRWSVANSAGLVKYTDNSATVNTGVYAETFRVNFSDLPNCVGQAVKKCTYAYNLSMVVKIFGLDTPAFSVGPIRRVDSFSVQNGRWSSSSLTDSFKTFDSAKPTQSDRKRLQCEGGAVLNWEDGINGMPNGVKWDYCASQVEK